MVAAVILLVFALGGAPFLQLMGISLEAFRIFGGPAVALVLAISLAMMWLAETAPPQCSAPPPRPGPLGCAQTLLNARSHTSWPRRSPRFSKRVAMRSVGLGM
jgi:hypothetical protein